MEGDLGDVWSILICIERIQPGVMCGDGHGFFGKPSSVRRCIDLFEHDGDRRRPDGHAKSTSLGVDVERDVQNGPHVGAMGGLFGRVERVCAHVHLNGCVGEQVHEVQHLDISRPLHVDAKRTRHQGAITGIRLGGSDGGAWI